VASSKIEGLVLSHRRLAKAAAVPSGDLTAHSVLANVAAIEAAYEFAHSSEPFSVDALKRIHARLFESTPQDRWGGVVRDRQNWIGGDATTPVTADFVPPPEGEVPRLLEDLAAFCNRIDLPPVLQAAVAHAQYETIHPFMDGNGRAGRCRRCWHLRARPHLLPLHGGDRLGRLLLRSDDPRGQQLRALGPPSRWNSGTSGSRPRERRGSGPLRAG
jgi:hypothetical protein